MTEPLHRYSRSGLAIEVYVDRIVIERGFLWSKQRDVIPLRSVASVSTAGLGRGRIIITDAGGRKHKHVIGRETDELLAAIETARARLP